MVGGGIVGADRCGDIAVGCVLDGIAYCLRLPVALLLAS